MDRQPVTNQLVVVSLPVEDDVIDSDPVGWVADSNGAGGGVGVIGAVGVGAIAVTGAVFFLDRAFFFAMRLAFFLAPFFALRFFAKQLHRRIVEVLVLINLLWVLLALVQFRACVSADFRRERLRQLF